MIVRKKAWPEFFELVAKGDKRLDIRLADFEIKPGDTLVLEEYDPKTKKYSGRKIEKKCKSVMKIRLADFYKKEDIEKHGIYAIEL